MQTDSKGMHAGSAINESASSAFLKTDGGITKSNAIEVPSIALPKGGGAIKGIDEKFSVNAVNGTASFSIPLPFAPARGASPALSLSYNSGSGNGIFELGWTINEFHALANTRTRAVMQKRHTTYMKLFGLFLFLILTQTCLAQFKVTKLDKSSIPKNIQYTGNIVQAVRWTDKTGDNIVILTSRDKTQIKNTPDDGYSDGAIYAYHYLVSGDSAKQTWKVYDYVKECSVDMFLYFVDKTFAVTDLNNDGKKEVWIMYKASCQGDVSPIPTKIIMYQDNKKFAIRGTTRVKVSANEYMGGGFTFDEAFKNAPAEFRKYAQKLWKQHKTEKWEQ